MKEFLRRLFGYVYIMNKHTGEVHFVPCVKYQCGIGRMGKGNQKYITQKQFDKIKFRYVNHKYVNGCKHCNKTANKE